MKTQTCPSNKTAIPEVTTFLVTWTGILRRSWFAWGFWGWDEDINQGCSGAASYSHLPTMDLPGLSPTQKHLYSTEITPTLFPRVKSSHTNGLFLHASFHWKITSHQTQELLFKVAGLTGIHMMTSCWPCPSKSRPLPTPSMWFQTQHGAELPSSVGVRGRPSGCTSRCGQLPCRISCTQFVHPGTGCRR